MDLSGDQGWEDDFPIDCNYLDTTLYLYKYCYS